MLMDGGMGGGALGEETEVRRYPDNFAEVGTSPATRERHTQSFFFDS